MSDPTRQKVNPAETEPTEAVPEEDPGAGKGPPGPTDIPEDFVRHCFDANEVGDGALFSVLNAGKYIYDANTKDTWYRFEGHHWRQDVEGYALGDIERVVEAYAPLLVPHLEHAEDARDALASADTKDEERAANRELKLVQKRIGRIERRIERLRSSAGRKNCLHCASTGIPRVYEFREGPLKKPRRIEIIPLVTTTEAFDNHPMLLPVANGVVDLETGKLRPGRPGDLLTKAAATVYPELDPGPPEAFLDFLHTSLGSLEMVEYLQRLIGYSIMGRIDDHIFVMLYSERGRSGKTTLMEILFTILSELATPIPAEMLLKQRNPRNSAGPSPDIMLFKGRRLVCASETDEGRRFDIAAIKLYSGGDRMQARAPHDKQATTWLPTHTLWMLTNFPPHASALDEAFWERFRFIKFPYTFKQAPKEAWERPIIRGLSRTLMAEGPKILYWMVKGALIYQRRGLMDPEQVMNDRADYRKGEDTIEDFIRECCDRSEAHKETIRDLYEVFRRWWRVRVNNRPISKNLFARRIKIKFGDPAKIDGYPAYHGLKLKDIDWQEYFK